ncbi:MOSC domain-containing protein [Actinoplanes friuliensis]|uniref:MOSC domain-containing protein n=1 Tax=Actinoplanes friuliensis DSM 7358 TaxID=1246995 RepID=U5VQP8_9ACTN|nr:MOSC domain-containing protein [Actinoplanes friuliensis]AGZ39154.1 MOSC domain-containing protein [Actinoplanes friuliensis DSM 7358]
MTAATVLQVNLAVPEKTDAKRVGTTGINKQPVDHPVEVRAPGPKTTGLHSGLVGDQIFDIDNHGGNDQAVYVYAREDYDWWEGELDRKLTNGLFGENLTTEGLDVNGAFLGETWKIGDELILATTFGRIPCATFQWKMGEPRWVKRFGAERKPGAYLRVVQPGFVQAGDRVEILDRPSHGVTIAESYHSWLHEPEELRAYLDLDLPDTLKNDFRSRLRI